jgi:hypothetical protein
MENVTRTWPVILLLGLAILVLNAWPNKAPAANSGSSGREQNLQNPAYVSSIKVPEPEPRNLAALSKITAAQAMAAAQTAYPGSKVEKVALENENGYLVYAVNLSNGLEVEVDAGNAKVLHTESSQSEAGESKHGKTEED